MWMHAYSAITKKVIFQDNVGYFKDTVSKMQIVYRSGLLERFKQQFLYLINEL